MDIMGRIGYSKARLHEAGKIQRQQCYYYYKDKYKILHIGYKINDVGISDCISI
jgi:hypothetical protein